MDSALVVDRLQFAFTITYHYLFPQLTMGLALLILVLKTLALRTGDDRYDDSARFWARIFGINFVFGVVTGIPMEFQFGTNWAAFSKYGGAVVGQTLAMEGMFAFFLESSFLGLFLFGERRLGPRGHWVAAFLVFLGAWLSGYFIVVTDAWMQQPVGYQTVADGTVQLTSFVAMLTSPWALWQYAHTMSGAAITGSVVMASVGAFYVLSGRAVDHGRKFLTVGVLAGCLFSILQLFPTGDQQGKLVAEHQPVTLAAMEAVFETGPGVPLVIIGQPNMKERSLDNPVTVPRMLSFLTYRRWDATVKGLDAFPADLWPDNIPLLYYSYHIMVGLGTIMIAVLLVATFLLWRHRLHTSRWMLWILMLMIPFPYIANTAGWITAEIGRQPWLVYGLMRTSRGFSPEVSAGNGLFTLMGFMGMYTVMSILFLFLIHRELDRGPAAPAASPSH
jgi:cytochrome d ubiquinol oxidase subunit I